MNQHSVLYSLITAALLKEGSFLLQLPPPARQTRNVPRPVHPYQNLTQGEREDMNRSAKAQVTES